MFTRMLMILLLSGLLFACGCKKSSNQAPAENAVVKTAAEYDAQAKKEITEENMDSELQNIEKEMQQEPAQ